MVDVGIAARETGEDSIVYFAKQTHSILQLLNVHQFQNGVPNRAEKKHINAAAAGTTVVMTKVATSSMSSLSFGGGSTTELWQNEGDHAMTHASPITVATTQVPIITQSTINTISKAKGFGS